MKRKLTLILAILIFLEALSPVISLAEGLSDDTLENLSNLKYGTIYEVYIEEYVLDYDETDPFSLQIHLNINAQHRGFSVLYPIILDETKKYHNDVSPSYDFTLKNALISGSISGMKDPYAKEPYTNNLTLATDGVKRSHKFPVVYNMMADNGYKKIDTRPAWFVAKLKKANYTQQEIDDHYKSTQAYWGSFIEQYVSLLAKAEEIEAQGPPKKTGDYYPRDAEMLRRAAYEMNVVLTGNLDYFHDPRMKMDRGRENPMRFDLSLLPEQIPEIIRSMDGVFDYVENNRVKDREITGAVLQYGKLKKDTYYGEIDKEAKTVTFWLSDYEKEKDNELYYTFLNFVISKNWPSAMVKSGSNLLTPSGIHIQLDKMKKAGKDRVEVPLVAVEPLYFNNITKAPLDYYSEPYKDTEEIWTFIAKDSKDKDKEPPKITGLNFTSLDGKRIPAEINQVEKEIVLSISPKEDLTYARIDLQGTGDSFTASVPVTGKEIVVQIEGRPTFVSQFNRPAGERLSLYPMFDIYYEEGRVLKESFSSQQYWNLNLKKDVELQIFRGEEAGFSYTLKVERTAKAEKELKLYSVNEAEKITRDGKEITVHLPYSYSGNFNFSPLIRVSNGATVKPQSGELVNLSNPIRYIITAENGEREDFFVHAEKLPPSSEKEILSFGYKAKRGKINGDRIELHLPVSEDITKFTPFIEISKHASLSPGSEEPVDFSKGVVEYTVTAEDGSKRTYYVMVIADEPIDLGPNIETLNRLKDLREKIYKKNLEKNASSMEEWLAKGIIEGVDNGVLSEGASEKGYRYGFVDNPEAFDLQNLTSNVNPNSLKEISKLALTLTSLGMEATKADFYTSDRKLTWFRGERQEEVYDLIAEIGKTKKSMIREEDAIYALMAYDSGDYFVSKNAEISRKYLIERLLKADIKKVDNPYDPTALTGTDKASMIILALSPHRTDKEFSEAVIKKQQECLDFLLKEMDGDFLFKDKLGVSSVSTSRAILALLSLGVDPSRDLRFAENLEKNLVTQWIKNFAGPNAFGERDKEPSTYASAESVLAVDTLLKHKEKGKEASPYILQKDNIPFDYSNRVQSGADLFYVQALGQEGKINDETGEITVYVPLDTTTAALEEGDVYLGLDPEGGSSRAKIYSVYNTLTKVDHPKMTIMKYDLTKPVVFTVVSEDEKTIKKYILKVEKKADAGRGEKDIESVEVIGFPKASVLIDKEKGTVKVKLPAGSPKKTLSTLAFSIKHKGESISPNPESPKDFSGGKIVTYKISAKDGSEKVYQFTAEIKTPDPYVFTLFSLRGVEGEIDPVSNVITIPLPKGTYLREASPDRMEYEFKNPALPGEELYPLPGGIVRMNFQFGQEQLYTLRSSNAKKKVVEYQVRAYESEMEGTGEIQSFKWYDYQGEITEGKIILKLPERMTLKELTDLADRPEINWTGERLDPDPTRLINSIDDFSKDYIVTDSKGNSKRYELVLQEMSGLKPPTKEDDDNNEDYIKLLEFRIEGEDEKGYIDDVARTIRIQISKRTNPKHVYVRLKLPKGVISRPMSGLAMDLTASPALDLEYKGLKKRYTIHWTYKKEPGSRLWDMLERDRNTPPSYQIVD